MKVIELERKTYGPPWEQDEWWEHPNGTRYELGFDEGRCALDNWTRPNNYRWRQQ